MRDLIPGEKWEHCDMRKATVLWIGAGSALDLVHGGGEAWCELCVVSAQLDYAEERAGSIASLRRRLGELEAEAKEAGDGE